jgi:hypothetical protein
MIQKFLSIFKGFFSHNNKQVTTELGKEEPKVIENIDMTNVIHSMFLAENLYNQLKIQCHPDLFVHDEKLVKISTEIFQKLSANRRNLRMLNEIKEEAISNLKIKV